MNHINRAHHEKYQQEEHDINHRDNDDLRLREQMEIPLPPHQMPLLLPSEEMMASAFSITVKISSIFAQNGMDNKSENSDTKTCRRCDKRFANPPGDSHRLSRL